jgi:hypothetical protein
MRNAVSTDAPPFFQGPYSLVSQPNRESRSHITAKYIQKYGVSSEAPQYLRTSQSPVVVSNKKTELNRKFNPNFRTSCESFQYDTVNKSFDNVRSFNGDRIFRTHAKKHSIDCYKASQISELFSDSPSKPAHYPGIDRNNSKSEESFHIKRGMFTYDPTLQHNIVTRTDKEIKGKLELQIQNLERMYRNRSGITAYKSSIQSPVYKRQELVDYRLNPMERSSINSLKMVLNPSDKAIRKVKPYNSKSPDINTSKDIEYFEKMLDANPTRLPPITKGNQVQIYDKSAKIIYEI